MPLHWKLVPSLGWGLVAGSGSLAALLLFQFWVGWLQVPARSKPGASEKTAVDRANLLSTLLNVLLILVLALWIGWTEELIFRGFLQDQLERDLPIWLAATIASLIFALLHSVWEGKTVLPQLPGLWLMGMVLVLARWVDHGNLGLAWGLHAGWVWTIASCDSLQFTPAIGIVPAWVIGIDGKPLAGVIGLLFLLGTAVCLWWIS